MDDLLITTDAAPAASAMRPARVVGTFSDPATVLVEELGSDERFLCDVLVTGSGTTLSLGAGDVVLVFSDTHLERPVLVGRIGATTADDPTPGADADQPIPDVIVLEATHALVLRVGNGTIEMRGDGKILIKGSDLVSHATRTNRVKGGAVAIN